MGWQDRDYSLRSLRERAAAMGVRKPPAVTLALLVLHGVAFVVMLLSASGALANLPDFAAAANPARHPLGVVLHPLATTSFLELLFVELALWSLGGRLEALVGGAAALGIYLGANLTTGAVYVGILAMNAAIAVHAPAYPLGALAAWCAIVARRSRWESADVLGRVVRVGTLYSVCAAVVAVLTLLARGRGATAWLIAGLAGGAAGYLLDLALPWMAARVRVPRERVPRRTPPRAARGPRSAARVDEAEVDAILAKISRAGIGSLTDEERARLEAAREARLRRDRDREC